MSAELADEGTIADDVEDAYYYLYLPNVFLPLGGS